MRPFACLSKTLHFFFSVYIPVLWREREKGEGREGVREGERQKKRVEACC